MGFLPDFLLKAEKKKEGAQKAISPKERERRKKKRKQARKQKMKIKRRK